MFQDGYSVAVLFCLCVGGFVCGSSLFVPHLPFWCLRKAVLRDCVAFPGCQVNESKRYDTKIGQNS